MSYQTDDTYDVYNEQDRRARKPHVCSACSETIPVGATYTNVSIVYDGRAETIKRCARCQKIHKHLRDNCEPGEQWPDERLNCGRSYREEWDCDPPEEIAALAFARPGDA